jgi:hypothetical protein
LGGITDWAIVREIRTICYLVQLGTDTPWTHFRAVSSRHTENKGSKNRSLIEKLEAARGIGSVRGFFALLDLITTLAPFGGSLIFAKKAEDRRRSQRW